MEEGYLLVPLFVELEAGGGSPLRFEFILNNNNNCLISDAMQQLRYFGSEK